MFVNRSKIVRVSLYCGFIISGVIMDEDQLFELEYHDEMEVLAEIENGKYFNNNNKYFYVRTGYRTYCSELSRLSRHVLP